LGQVECEATLPFLPRFMLMEDEKIKAIEKMKEAIENLDEDEMEEINKMAYNALRIKQARSKKNNHCSI